MQSIPFKGKIRRVAGTFVVTIPSDYVNNGIFPEGEEMQFYGEPPERQEPILDPK